MASQLASWKVRFETAFATVPADTLETTATGGTALRYDTTASTFVYNWKSPNAVGCYTVWINLSTGQQFPVYFQLK